MTTRRTSKRLRTVHITAGLATAGYVAVVATGFLAPDAVGAVAGAFAVFAGALGLNSGSYTYSEGRRPSAGGGEWAGPVDGPAPGAEYP